MSLTKLAATAAEIRAKKGFSTPTELGSPAKTEAEMILAGLSAHVSALARVAEGVRTGDVPLDTIKDVLGARLADADDVLLGVGVNPDAMLAKLVLIMTEVGEAIDAVMDGHESLFAEELADIVIRVLDIAGTMGINLDFEVARKMNINAGRPERHGKLA